jgi:hypothetical protein
MRKSWPEDSITFLKLKINQRFIVPGALVDSGRRGTRCTLNGHKSVKKRLAVVMWSAFSPDFIVSIGEPGLKAL